MMSIGGEIPIVEIGATVTPVSLFGRCAYWDGLPLGLTATARDWLATNTTLAVSRLIAHGLRLAHPMDGDRFIDRQFGE
jgi:hypothetical protein